MKSINPRLLKATARLVIPIIGGFACGHLLLNKGGDRPYAGPLGAATAGAAAVALVSHKKRRDNLHSISRRVTPQGSYTCSSTPPASTPFTQVKASAKVATQVAAKVTAKVDPEQPHLEFIFERNEATRRSLVYVLSHNLLPLDHLQPTLTAQLFAIDAIKWSAPQRSRRCPKHLRQADAIKVHQGQTAPSILMFKGHFNSQLSMQAFRNQVAEPLLGVAVKYNGDKPIETWLRTSSKQLMKFLSEVN